MIAEWGCRAANGRRRNRDVRFRRRRKHVAGLRNGRGSWGTWLRDHWVRDHKRRWSDGWGADDTRGALQGDIDIGDVNAGFGSGGWGDTGRLDVGDDASGRRDRAWLLNAYL